MSQLYVDNIRNRTGGPIGIPTGAVVTGVVTATTGNITGNQTVGGNLTVTGNAEVGGVLTYEDVTNIDSVGIITAQSGIRVGAGESIGSDGAAVVYYGDGSNLDGVVSGIELEQAGSSVGTSVTAINFAWSNTNLLLLVFQQSLLLLVSTLAATVSGIVTFLSLGDAQDHKLTVSGISTISCTGGTEGDSHTVRIVNSGITTIGFSTFFLFPSGAAPSLPTADGAISLISFTVHRVGAGGTQLLAGASVNYSEEIR